MHRHASVNRIYRLVWSHASSSWVPAAETSRGRKKGSCKTLLATALSLVAGFTEAGPLGGQVVGGSGQIGQSGVVTTITQISPVLSLSWASFNIAPQETVDFVQPSSSAIAVNRITGTDGTQILGHLEANGQVYLVNPNGIVFGRGSQVNVGGLVASTLDANDASLGSAARTFSGTGSGSVTNQGTINATGDGSGGGYVALLGTHVANQGTIIAQLGTVALGAGSAATLTFQGDSLVHLQVDRSVLNSMAANGGLIRADGGQVLMSAGAKDSLLASVVNNTGIIEARAVENHAGTITLLGGMDAGTVNVAGTLDASAPNGGNGGFIETSAANVEVANSAKITTAAAAGLTGSWLIDPHDFTVAASGGDITGAALSGELATTNETLQSSGGTAGGSGNVNVNDAISWGADTTLTLIASNNVNVNASITATGNHAGVVINPNTGNGGDAASGVGALTFNQGAAVNLTGTNATASVAGVSYIIVNTLGVAADATTAPGTPSLQGMAATANLSKNYALGSNIDATATSGWNAGAGFTPIGNYNNPFKGAFTGLGHTISNLFIDLPTTNDVGLFGWAGNNSGTLSNVPFIQNVGLVGGSVTGSNNVGSLVGEAWENINNTFATGTVAGSNNVGGLIGVFGSYFNALTLTNSYATGAVAGVGNVGGLIGQSGIFPLATTLNNAYATGNVSGSDSVGGLVGYQYHGGITNSHATGSVTGSGGSAVGGLVGAQSYGSISSSYATGNVSVAAGGSDVGGLVGDQSDSSIGLSYATGNVTVGASGSNVGGLVGNSDAGNYGSSISNSYATGSVTVPSGGSNVGGLVGVNTGVNYAAYGNPALATISNSYASGNVSAGSGSTAVGGLVGNNIGFGGVGSIFDSYATGAVTGSQNSGGLVGLNAGLIETTYATGNVAGSASSIGGLVGANSGAVVHGYWDTTTSGQATSAQTGGSQTGVGGLSTSQMRTASNFAGFVFSTTPGASGNSWVMVDTDGSLNNASGSGATFPMLTSEYSTAIGNAHQLQLMAMALGANYTLAANVDASATGTAVAIGSGDVWSTTGGFVPVGRASAPFTGSLDGSGYTIGNLNINLGSNYNVGLFGVASSSSTIQNVGIIGGSVRGYRYIGDLAGQDAGSINNSYSTGAVSSNYETLGYYPTGGLVGLSTGAISNSYATGSVFGCGEVGGLVGESDAPISNSYATGNVTSQVDASATGGLVGLNRSTITNSYATGAVNGANATGGLVGNNLGSIDTSHATGAVYAGGYSSPWAGGLVGTNGNTGSISRSYATGKVNGGGYGTAPGGLVGYNGGSISKSYATGMVTGGGGYGAPSSAGGLVGVNGGTIADSWAGGAVSGSNAGGLVGVNSVTISNSYSTGAVTGSSPGGLVGSNGGTVSNSFWDTTTSGVATSAGGTGMITSDMQLQANFTSATAANGYVNPNWDFASTWSINGQSYPLLTGGVTLIPLTITADNVSKIYNGSAFSGDSNGVTFSIPGAASDFTGTLAYTGTSQGDIDVGAGTFSITPGGLQQTTNEYIVTYVSGTLTMSPLALSATLATGSSVYGAPLAPGALTFTNAIGSGTVMASTVAVNTTGLTSSSGHLIAGTHSGIESVGTTLTGVDASDYTFAGATGDYTVTPLALTGAIATGSSIYGSTLTPGAVTLNAPIVGDVVMAGTVAVNTVGLTSTSGHLNAGTHTGIESVGNALTGADAGDYTFAGATGNYTVTPLALTGAIATGGSIYGSALTPGAVTLNIPISGDVVTADATVTVNTTNQTSTSGHLTAGTHTGIESVGGTLTGADAADYTFAGATGDYTVTPLALTGAIATGGSIYGSPLAPGAVTLTTPIVGDDVTAGAVTVSTTNQTSTSGHLTAGTHTGIESVIGTLTGADAGDYTFAGATGNYIVTPLALSGVIATGSSIYGSALTPGAVTLNPIIGDVVIAGIVTVTTTNQTSTSGHLTAGTHTGIESVIGTLTGADAGDYTFAGTTGNYTVTPLAISVAATGANKIYDGTTLAAPTLSSTAVILGDQIAFADTAANFAGKNAGSGQTVTVSGITIGGADAADYVLNGATAMTTATISPASLTVSGVAVANKTYDGTTTAILTDGSIAGVIAGDAGSVALVDAGSFTTKNVGTGIAIAPAETLSGAGAGNYVVVQPTGLAANITPATLTYDATAASRTAGQSPAGLTGTLSGFVVGESQSIDTAGTLVWTTPANAGSGAGRYAIDGAGLTATNYVFVEAPGNAEALTLIPAAVPPVVPPAMTLPPAALGAIAALQAMMQGSGDGPPERPATFADSVEFSGFVDSVEDTRRRIGKTSASLTIVSGGVRLPP